MKKLTILLLLTSLFSYAQVDYKGLIKNIEDVTIKTDIKDHFKGIPFDLEYGDLEFNDERFLRLYGVIINKVKFSSGWSGTNIDITPFDEKADYNKIKNKLIELYGVAETNVTDSRIKHNWETNDKLITLTINLEEEDEQTLGQFKDFENFEITLKQQ